MTALEILNLASIKLDDMTAPYLWETEEFVAGLNWAINRACRRGKLIRDSKTAAICTISLLAADTSQDYALDSRVIDVERAKLATCAVPMTRSTRQEMDEQFPTWRDAGNTAGTPLRYCLDYSDHYISLDRISDKNESLYLTVIRLPLAQISMSNLGVTPELDEDFHVLLVDGIMSQSYLKQDDQTYFPAKAKEHMAIFDASIAEMSKAKLRLTQTAFYVGPHLGAR